MEDQEQYLKRISGLQRLYSAVLITKLRRNEQHIEHPHGLENGWIWLSNFLMLDPLPGISPTLLLEFIQISGSEMWKCYKRQFIKLMIALHNQYILKLDKVRLHGVIMNRILLWLKIFQMFYRLTEAAHTHDLKI